MLFDKKREMEEVADKNDLLKMSEISLILDTYDDIFSDFDPRPFHTRALSDDFLQEIRRATRDRPVGTFELKFMMPHHSRNLVSENLIKRRLKEHFKRHYSLLLEENKKIKFKGIGMAFLGVCLLMLSAWLYSIASGNLFIHFLIFLFEPAGWFTAWTGLDQLFYDGRQQGKEVDFYRKMSEADINFLPY
jgi:hypothetical protein